MLAVIQFRIFPSPTYKPEELRRIFGLKREEVTEQKKLHNEDVHNFHSSPNG
jgi:hypothetical protein